MLGRVATVAELFEALCLRWAREADVVYQQTGAVAPTLVVLPRDAAAEEVAIRVDGLRGNLAERAGAILADLRPAVAPHRPAGLVFLSELRLGAGPAESGTDGVAVYVTLGSAAYRRAVGLRVVPGTPPSLTRADTDPPVDAFAWLDALLAP
ncbi:MAG: hypothetical protein QOE45_1965 [Frankiaceae bacterium]|jgi:hypothetical protein|nr:hypothetical protein [Frankiaceae bacterium]